jgi:hypothetical protein
VSGSGEGLAGIARLGHLRSGQPQTRAEIWRSWDEETPGEIAERPVPTLLAVDLARRRASRQDRCQHLRATGAEHGGIVVALEGLPPEQGNEPWWVVREVLSGAVLGAAPLPPATASRLAPLLRPIPQGGRPVRGVIRDAPPAIRGAVAPVFPGVPPQLGP